MIIRSASSGDRFTKAKSACTLDSHFDIDYVWHKCPHARSSHAWLIEHLGKANTGRREYFRYWDEHHKKLSQSSPGRNEQNKVKTHPSSEESPLTVMNRPEPSSFSSTRPPSTSISPTTASTYVETTLDDKTEEFEVASDTTIATSLGRPVEDELCIPSRPKAALNGKPFECPFCYTIQVARNERSWR